MNTPSSRKQAAYQRGVDAEAIAAQHLRGQGLEVLALRHRNAGGEIDVLARNDDTLIVVEVKARKAHEEGLYSVTPAKQKRLIRATEALLAEGEKFAGLGDLARFNIRFDVIVIVPGKTPLHLPNAFYVE
ncbi:MAG: YraN family protein [Rickettsiales bacterium]